MIIEYLKAFLLGVIQGITEWLPISSTGHMILFNEFVHLNVSDEFWSVFEVVIQLGSILAVLVLYIKRLIPFGFKKTEVEKKKTWALLLDIVIACIPAAIVGFFLDDWLDEHLYNYITVAVSLILYGIMFIVIERKNKNKVYPIKTAEDITPLAALKIGLFQLLAFIPGTSRSGSTIIGGMCFDISRTAAAEFSFFLAIPIMLGASFFKIIKFILKAEVVVTSSEMLFLAIGIVTAFVVSLAVIKLLMKFVRKHSFEAFGWYRIILGALVLGYFLIFKR